MFFGLLAYGNAVNHPFVHDDVVFIQQNTHLATLDLKSLFVGRAPAESEFHNVNQYYRPLLELVNKALYRIVRLNPHGFHFFNVLLHIVNSFLVYNCIQVITGYKKGISLVTALFFLLHPVQSEAVACIAGISNLVFAFLCLASFYSYVRSVGGNGEKRNPLAYMCSLFLFALALLAKEQSVVLPALIVVYELCFVKSSSGVLKRFRFVAGFFIVLAGYFLLRNFYFGTPLTLTHVVANKQELWLTWLAIPRSLLVYFSILIFPRNLHYYRSQDILLPSLGPILALLVIIVALIVLISRTPNPHKKWMIFGLSWFIIALSPTLNIIPLVNEYSLILTAEHFLYFPIIGFLLFVMGCNYFWFKHKTKEEKFVISFLVCFIISICFLGITVKQNTYWRGEIPLFERTLTFEKDFGRVHFLLAQAYAKAGRFEDAVEADRKALAIMQGYAQKVQNEKIREFYLVFVKQIQFHLGFCLGQLGDLAGALKHIKEALLLDPHNQTYHFVIGQIYAANKNMASAITHFEKIIEFNADHLLAMTMLARCYQHIGEDAKAEKYLRLIVEKDSKSVLAKQNLANFLNREKSL